LIFIFIALVLETLPPAMVVRLRVLGMGVVVVVAAEVGMPIERRDFLRPLSQSEPVSSKIPGGMAKPGVNVER